MDIRALIFNGGTFERKQLRKMNEQQLFDIWYEDKQAQVQMLDLDELSEHYNDREMSEQDWLFFVDFDNVQWRMYAKDTLVYDYICNQYYMIKGYDRKSHFYDTSLGSISRELVRTMVVDVPNIKNEHTEHELPDWCKVGNKVHFGGECTGNPHIKAIGNGLVWIERIYTDGGRNYYAKSIDAFLRMVGRKYIEPML